MFPDGIGTGSPIVWNFGAQYSAGLDDMSDNEYVPEERQDLVTRPEETIYRTIYAPVDVGSMLASAETRSKIRRELFPVHVDLAEFRKSGFPHAG